MLEYLAVVMLTAIVILFADFFDCRELRLKQRELIESGMEREDRIIDLERQLLRAWWDGMEEAARIADNRFSANVAAVEIRKRIQERATS